VYLEVRNHEILGQCYRVGAAIEANWGANSRVLPKTARHWSRWIADALKPLVPWSRLPDPVDSGDAIFATLAQGRRMYFRVLRLMFLLAALAQFLGALFFLFWADAPDGTNKGGTKSSSAAAVATSGDLRSVDERGRYRFNAPEVKGARRSGGDAAGGIRRS
jgi:hypothetical protein